MDQTCTNRPLWWWEPRLVDPRTSYTSSDSPILHQWGEIWTQVATLILPSFAFLPLFVLVCSSLSTEDSSNLQASSSCGCWCWFCSSCCWLCFALLCDLKRMREDTPWVGFIAWRDKRNIVNFDTCVIEVEAKSIWQLIYLTKIKIMCDKVRHM